MTESLASLGYRMPAEWEPHAATWFAWPHCEPTWPDGRLPAVARIFAGMARALVEGEQVHFLVNDHEMETYARRILREERADSSDVHFHHIATNDAWIRDHGPIFVRARDGRDPRIIALDWGFNSWGEKYPPFDEDNRVPGRVASELGVPAVTPGMILEGGSVDVDGAGLLLTTETCLLNKNRNPHLTREAIEQRLRDNLGVQKILWLGDGIVGDDTDGHVDDITRFVGNNRIVTAVEADRDDPNHAPLQENRERLAAMTNLEGRPFEIIEIPMPIPIEGDEERGRRLPASYANFLIANAVVLVPLFGGPKDHIAMGVLRELFPGRRIVGVPGPELVYGLGAVHCLSQQQPR